MLSGGRVQGSWLRLFGGQAGGLSEADSYEQHPVKRLAWSTKQWILFSRIFPAVVAKRGETVQLGAVFPATPFRRRPTPFLFFEQPTRAPHS